MEWKRMPTLKEYCQETKTRYYQSFANNRVPVRLERPIISITFDDVPRTALENGVPILDRHNIKATFYVATGLSKDSINKSRDENIKYESYLYPDDIAGLHLSGHNIACHTYSHYMLDSGSPEGLERDAYKNIEALKSILGPVPIEHFSYPFGQVNFKTKKLLSKYYKSMRSSRPGINLSPTDLNLLRATSIYNPTFNKAHIIKLIKTTEQYGGWLIFYTHGVEDFPDNYSCTPVQFEWLIKQCSKSTAQLLTVSDACNTILSDRTALINKQ